MSIRFQVENEDWTNGGDKTNQKSDYLSTIVSDDDVTVDCGSHPDDDCRIADLRTDRAVAAAFAAPEPSATSEAEMALELGHS